MQKQTYTRPEFRIHGDIKAVTLANTGGLTLDAAFNVGDSIDDLTTS